MLSVALSPFELVKVSSHAPSSLAWRSCQQHLHAQLYLQLVHPCSSRCIQQLRLQRRLLPQQGGGGGCSLLGVAAARSGMLSALPSSVQLGV